MKFIDLFAGIGGFRIALEKNGCNCVFSSEMDKHAQKTYQHNFNDMPNGDITKIESTEIPDFDILCGGFPCQPFSIAGNQTGFDHKKGNLFFEIERILKDKQPKAFILENVKGLVSNDKGRTLKYIVKSLDDLGYYFNYKVLNTLNFGLPQNRERVFFVGFRKDLNIYLFDILESSFEKRKSIDDILEKEIDEKYIMKGKWLEWFNKNKEKLIRKKYVNIIDKIASTLTARQYANWNGNFIYQIRRKEKVRINKKNVCPTLLAAHMTTFLERNNKIRKLTPRECARLQGFPDSYDFPVSDTQAYKQIGNSVSIPVVYSVANTVINLLKGVE